MIDLTRRSAVSVPGKLILMGEHSAVYGHPAMVAAIDLRLGVDIVERPGPGVEIVLPQLDYRGEFSWAEITRVTDEAHFLWDRYFGERADPSDPYPTSPHNPERLVQIALGEAANGTTSSERPGLRVSIDSEIPVGSGFGSSAALAVGVAAAYLDMIDGRLDHPTIHRVSSEIERRQHGSPSGVDNSTVIHGGLLWAHRDSEGGLVCETMEPRSPSLEKLRVFHSGCPEESTGVLVAAVRRRIGDARRRFRAVLSHIHDVTRELRNLILHDREEPTTLLDLVRQCEALLEELGVVPKPLQRVIRKVEAAGGAAKISGAGGLAGPGGGSVLVYHPDPEQIATWDFISEWLPMPVRLGAPGLRRERQA